MHVIAYPCNRISMYLTCLCVNEHAHAHAHAHEHVYQHVPVHVCVRMCKHMCICERPLVPLWMPVCIMPSSCPQTQKYILTIPQLYMLAWLDTGWRRPTGCLKLQVIFRKRATNYRAPLRKMTYKDKASYDSTPPCTQNIESLNAFRNHLKILCHLICNWLYELLYMQCYICVLSHPRPPSHKVCHMCVSHVYVTCVCDMCDISLHDFCKRDLLFSGAY